MKERRTFTPADVAHPKRKPLTPHIKYGKCMDCGTEEGQPCFDVDDNPIISVCIGRTLSDKGEKNRQESRNKYRKKLKTSVVEVSK